MNSFFMYSELKALHTNLICFQAERNNALSFTFKNPSHPSMTLHRGVNHDKWCPSRIQIGQRQMKLGQSSSSRHGSRSSLTIHTRGTAGPPMVLANWKPKSIFWCCNLSHTNFFFINGYLRNNEQSQTPKYVIESNVYLNWREQGRRSYCQDTMLQKGNSPWSCCRPTRNLRKHLGVRVQLNQSHQNYIQKINHIAYWICQLCEMEKTHKSHWSTAKARDLGSETAWRERQTHSRIEDPYGFSGLDAVLWTTAERSDHHSLVLASASHLWRYCKSLPEPFKTSKEQESNLDHCLKITSCKMRRHQHLGTSWRVYLHITTGQDVKTFAANDLVEVRSGRCALARRSYALLNHPSLN